MDKAKEFLTLNEEVVSETVSRLTVPPDRVGGIDDISLVDVVLEGIRVDRVQPGLIICSFPVPPRLPDGTGNFATGAISYLIDALGGAVAYVEGRPMNVSVDVSISFLSMAKPDRTMSIVPQKPYDTYRMSWRLPQGFKAGKGGYSGTVILIRNKATGEVVAEGRHSFFSKRTSKL